MADVTRRPAVVLIMDVAPEARPGALLAAVAAAMQDQLSVRVHARTVDWYSITTLTDEPAQLLTDFVTRHPQKGHL